MLATVCPCFSHGCLLVCTIQINIAFTFPFQLQTKKTDHIKAVEASVKVLLDNTMKETAELIKKAQTECDGAYSQLYLSTLYFQFLSWFLLESQFQVLLIPNNLNFSLPPDAKLHNLLSLVAKDVAITPSPEETGSSLLVQHQKLMLEHSGYKHTAILPEDIIWCLLLGVSF